MARKKSLYESKNAESCPCGCCKWHSSRAVRGVLAAMFILIVLSFAASLFNTSNPYYGSYILSFMGVIFLVVFTGWIFGFFCSCRGLHWSRHGYSKFDESLMTARRRYANGEITRSEYNKVLKDLQ